MTNNQCDGCQRGLPVHLGMHVAEQEMFMCTATGSKLELEPIERDYWPSDKARKKSDVPFTFGCER